MGLLMRTYVLLIIALVHNFIVVSKSFADIEPNDKRIDNSIYTPESRFTPEVEIPLTKKNDDQNGNKEKSLTFYISIGFLLVIATFITSEALITDSSNDIIHIKTGSVKGSW